MKRIFPILLLLVFSLTKVNSKTIDLSDSPQHCFDAAINMYDAVSASGGSKLLASLEADAVYETCMML
ncbi:MAG: hypothetical protein U1C58_11610 [Flavobacteriaceae bacterium]|nr:hypothetical protein [Flavobacteriaceae bacterium]